MNGHKAKHPRILNQKFALKSHLPACPLLVIFQIRNVQVFTSQNKNRAQRPASCQWKGSQSGNKMGEKQDTK